MDFIVADASTTASDHPSYSRRNSNVVEEINRDDTIYKQPIVKQECKAIGWNETSSADDDDDNDEDDELEDDEDDQTLSEHKESINEKSEEDHDREFHELSSSAEHKGRVWTKEEDEILLNLYKEKGSQWASMCSALPRWSRTQIKTRFKSLHRAGKRMWKRSEDELLLSKCGNMKKVDWSKIAHMFPGRTKNSLKIHFKQLIETNNGSKRSNHVQQQTLVPPAPGSPRQALIDNEEFLLLASKRQQPASQDDSLATPEPAIKKCRMEETDSQTLEIQIRPPSRSCSISPMMDVNTIRIPSSQSHQMWNQLNSQKTLVQNQASSTFAFMDPISASNQIHSSAQFNQLPRYHHNLLQQPQQQYPFYKQSMPFPLISQYNQQNSYMGHGVSLSSAPYGHIYRDGANMLNTLMFQQNSNPQINVQRL